MAKAGRDSPTFGHLRVILTLIKFIKGDYYCLLALAQSFFAGSTRLFGVRGAAFIMGSATAYQALLGNPQKAA